VYQCILAEKITTTETKDHNLQLSYLASCHKIHVLSSCQFIEMFKVAVYMTNLFKLEEVLLLVMHNHPGQCHATPEVLGTYSY
jgi:hypothetical protein